MEFFLRHENKIDHHQILEQKYHDQSLSFYLRVARLIPIAKIIDEDIIAVRAFLSSSNFKAEFAHLF